MAVNPTPYYDETLKNIINTNSLQGQGTSPKPSTSAGYDKDAMLQALMGGLSNVLGSILGKPDQQMPSVGAPGIGGGSVPFVPTSAMYQQQPKFQSLLAGRLMR